MDLWFIKYSGNSLSVSPATSWCLYWALSTIIYLSVFSVSKNTSTAVKPTVRLYNKSYRQWVDFFSKVAFISSCSYIFKKFSFFSCMFLNPRELDMRNFQEQVKKAFCYQNLFWPFTIWINCSSDHKIFANSWSSALNFKIMNILY